MVKRWTDEAWADFEYWLDTDKKKVSRIRSLLKDIEREPYKGTGKPEPLRHNLSGYWSRRIDQDNRLVYRVKDGNIEIIQCGSHYRQK